jgi:hypothetical protein
MTYKIEMRYVHQWGDAEWTEDADGVEMPMRFTSIEAANTAIDEFCADVIAAVAAGNMDIAERRSDYRVVPTND